MVSVYMRQGRSRDVTGSQKEGNKDWREGSVGKGGLL